LFANPVGGNLFANAGNNMNNFAPKAVTFGNYNNYDEDDEEDEDWDEDEDYS